MIDMRDTARARVERAQFRAHEQLASMRGGRKAIDMAATFAKVATAPVAAPEHGAEYARAMLYFASELGSETAAELLARQYEDQGVIWKPTEQVAAAKKQIGRLRSDAQKAERDAIPLTSLVYADDPADFTGRSYHTLTDAELPVKDSFGDTIRVRHERRRLTVRTEQLRYVEGPMIRPR